MLCRHIEQLAGRHSIDLIAFGDASGQGAGIDPIKALCNSVEIIPLPKLKILINLIGGIFSSEPMQVCLYQSKSMSEAVENRLHHNTYDVVIVQLTRMAQFLPQWYQGRTMLNMVDPLILNYVRSLNWRPWYVHIALRQEIARLRRYETQHTPRFDRVSLISQADIIDYQALFENVSFAQVSYGIDTDYFQPDATVNRVPGMIVITGNMGYAPNVDAVKYFCRDVFPSILAKEPKAHLWLVGVRPTSEIERLGCSKNITVTGYVNDVRHYLRRAMVSVCPIRLNVGIQTKVLEALATGTPVVTTTAGNRGVGGKSGTDLYVADTPLEIADRVLSVLRGENWNEFSENGRQFVQDHFQWKKSAMQLECVLNTLVNRTRDVD